MGKFSPGKVSVGIVRDVTQVPSAHKVAKMPKPAKSPNTTHGIPKVPVHKSPGSTINRIDLSKHFSSPTPKHKSSVMYGKPTSHDGY